MSNISESTIGFVYTFETVRDGVVIDSETIKNIVPLEGLNYILSATLLGGLQNSSYYIGIYEGNFTPTAASTAANIPAASTECTAYNETARPTWVPGAVAAGGVDNSANKAVFTMNATKTVYGAYLVSGSPKSSIIGTLLSAVKFPSPKNLAATDIFRVTAGLQLVSA